MKRIETVKFLELWDKLKELEWETDSGMCELLDMSTGTVSRWRSGLTKEVQPQIIRLIQTKLNYKISIASSGEWQIQKLGEVSQSTESENDQRRRTETGEREKMCQLLELHGLDSLDKVRRFLRRKDELEAMYLSFEDISRKVKLKAEDDLK